MAGAIQDKVSEDQLITYLENFYIQDGVFHIVFNMDSDPIVDDSKGVLDIQINKEG